MVMTSRELFAALLVLVPALCECSDAVDYAAWDRVMRRHVHPGKVREGIIVNEVDYCGIKMDSDYLRFMASLAEARTTDLSKQEFYALYMNAYNALTVAQMINQCMEGPNGTCVTQLRYIGGYQGASWSKPAGVIAGKVFNTETVESWLRNPKLAGYNFSEDCRVHGCIVCAGISCPDLRNEAYTPDKVDEQMSDNVVKWLANSKKGSVILEGGQINVSNIISELYPADMQGCYGESGAVEFVSMFGPADVKQLIATTGKASVKLGSLVYNYDSNGPVPCDQACPASTAYPSAEQTLV